MCDIFRLLFMCVTFCFCLIKAFVCARGRGKTIHCVQLHDILWNHSIIEEKKILPLTLT